MADDIQDPLKPLAEVCVPDSRHIQFVLKLTDIHAVLSGIVLTERVPSFLRRCHGRPIKVRGWRALFRRLADDVLFEFRYEFPGWPRVTRGRDNLMALYSGYGGNIRLDRADGLAVHPSGDGRVVTLEYEVHGRILKSGLAYDNRFVSIAFIENRKIVRWRDYMDSLAAWTAQTSAT